MAWSSSGFSVLLEDECGYQTLAREWGSVWKLRTRTRVTETRGLTESAALTFGEDVSYFTVTSGILYFAHYTRSVRRRKAQGNGWSVTVTETWSAAYKNSTWQCGAAASYFSAANPSAMNS